MQPIIGYEEEYLIAENGDIFRKGKTVPLRPAINPQNGYLYVSLWKNNQGYTTSVHRLVALHYVDNPLEKPFVNHKDSNRTNPHKDNLEWCTQSENIQHGYDYGHMSQDFKKKFQDFELKLHLESFLSGITITALSKKLNCGLTNLSKDLRRIAKQTDRIIQYQTELANQKRQRNAAAAAANRQQVIMMDNLGQTLQVFPSMAAAAKFLGKKSSGPISNALNPNHSQRKAYGFLWKLV